MWHHFTCEVSITFRDEDVNDWLNCEGELDDEDVKTHVPTYDELRRYAWECVENEDCEYGGVYEDH